LALLCASAYAQDLAQPTEFRVKLLGPISTETNQRGDKITAQVLTPAQYRGAIMEGEIKESKSGGKIKGTSVLNFSFDTLVRGSQRVPVKSSVDSVYNSKGKENVDEEGRVIRKKNNLGKAAIATGAGAIIGAIVGGGKGAAIGAGVGAAASLVLIQVAAEGANVTFAEGSEFLLSVQERERR
jgi:hypothetical protein